MNKTSFGERAYINFVKAFEESNPVFKQAEKLKQPKKKKENKNEK